MGAGLARPHLQRDAHRNLGRFREPAKTVDADDRRLLRRRGDLTSTVGKRGFEPRRSR